MQNMEEGALTNLTKLFDLLHSAHAATSMACQVLAASCYNYEKVIKKWPVPGSEKVSECTCKPCYNEPDEMEKNIVNAVERAKATRERVTQVTSINKRNTMKAVHDKSSESTSLMPRQKSSLCCSAEEGAGKDNRKIIVNKRDCVSTKPQEKNATAGHSRKVVNTKASMSRTLQTTYQSDFAVRNSYLILNTRKPKGKDLVKECMAPVSNTKLHPTVNKIDVDTLLKKVTTNAIAKGSSDNKINFVQDIIVDKACFLHGEGPQTIRHSFVGLKEAIDIVGVPSELLNVLRIYHQYIQVNNPLNVTRKKQNSRDTFLHHLNESNEKCWNLATSEPVINLYLHHLLVFVEILSKRKDGENGSLPRGLEEEINYLNKNYHSIVGTETKCDNKLLIKEKIYVTCSEDIVEKKLWALAGIWNRNCLNMFPGLKCSLKISYKRKEDCKSLQQNFQKMQALYLQIQILEALRNDIFPFLKNLQTDHIYLSYLYKSFSTLCDISALSVPVLLKI